MTSLRRQIAARQQRLLADKAALARAVDGLRRAWSARLGSPLIVAGGFGLGFALGLRRRKPQNDAAPPESQPARDKGAPWVLRTLATMAADIVVPVAVSTLQDRMRESAPATREPPEQYRSDTASRARVQG